jgi:signal transduction histidine kinase
MPNIKINLPTQINLEQFISAQAHDLRTPFNHITGFSKMLLNTVGVGPLTDFQKEDLGTVYRSGMHALTLMNGLIDIARINQHEKEANPKDTDIEQTIAQGLAQWKKFNPGTDVQTDYQILAATKTVRSDEQMLRQIVSGFVAFVALYCEARANITITVAEQPDWFLFTFTSMGVKSRQSSDLERDMLGYINRTLIEMQKGEIRQAEETDSGATVQFAFPKT